jgi:hypothetical protein
MKRFGGLVAAVAVAILLVATGVTPSDAARKPAPARSTTAYDGLWSVTIFTQAGPCDPSYRYPARIFRGQVYQAENDFSYQLTGAVNNRGAITVTVNKSGQSATGYGQLVGPQGGGWWNTAGGQCSGVWNAVRRR